MEDGRSGIALSNVNTAVLRPPVRLPATSDVVTLAPSGNSSGPPATHLLPASLADALTSEPGLDRPLLLPRRERGTKRSRHHRYTALVAEP